MSSAKYLIDSSVFIRFAIGQEYDKTCFPIQYEKFLKLLDEGIAISIDKVKSEVDDDFFCREYKDVFKPSINNDITDTYNDLKMKYPDYFNSRALDSPDDADAYLVTYAYHNNLCIVTQDEFQSTVNQNLDQKKYSIATLCQLLGATCIDNKNNRHNINQYDSGFGCICFTELIRLENLF